MHFIGTSVQLDRSGNGTGTYVAMAHGDVAIELGELQISADGLEVQALADVGKLNVAVVSGIKFQRAGHVRNASVFDFAIHLNVAGDGFYSDRAMAYVQRRWHL